MSSQEIKGIPPFRVRLSVAVLAPLLETFPRRVSSRKSSLKIQEQPNIAFKTLAVAQMGAKKEPPLVLMDSFPIPHWGLINTITAQQITDITGGGIATFGFSKRNFSERDLYVPLGVNRHLRISLNPLSFIKTLGGYVGLLLQIHSGKKVIDLHFRHIDLGIDVYESFLRRGHATLDLRSRDLYRELWRSVKQVSYFEPKFQKNQVTAVLISHDNYVGPGLLAGIAYRFQIPVISVNAFEINILDRRFQLYERFKRYRLYFGAQPLSWRNEHVYRAKVDLQRRIGGEIGIGVMKYQVKSAFSKNIVPRQIDDNQNRKILILCHDFFDNPHGFSRLPFDDFFEWLTFVADTCSDEKIDCYIKLHKDFSEMEFKVVEEFRIKFPFVKLVDSNISYHQLYEEGIRFVTTCFGSAGHELPLLGFTVINASYNPHVAYSFNHHASSKCDYRKMLIEQVPIVLNEELENEIYEFYSVHSFLMWPDQFNLSSFEKFVFECDGLFTSQRAFSYLERHYSEIYAQVSENFSDAIQSKRRFSVERKLSPTVQHRFRGETHHDLFPARRE